MSSRPWLLYGAYGFTGRLIAREAVERGHRPVLAGRDARKTAALADELGLEHRVFGLDDGEALRDALEPVAAVVNAAGPFSRTWRPVAEACLDTRTHYLDITGEVAVFEGLHALGGRAAAAGVALVPGVGLDVVPTDCLAARLAERLSGATHLELALHSTGGPSRGTARTMLEGITEPAKERRDGRIVEIAHGSVTARVPFTDRERRAVAIPWGDVSTAHHSTGIPNVRVYMTFPPRMLRAARLLPYLRPLLALGPVRRLLRAWIDWKVEGPDAREREEGRTRIRGRAWREEGPGEEGGSWAERGGGGMEAELTVPNGYAFTAASSVAAVEALLAMDTPTGVDAPSAAAGPVPPPEPTGPAAPAAAPTGFLTPSRAFGPEFLDTLPGVRWTAGGPEG